VQHPGQHTILARAITTRGQSQPTTHDPLNGGYVINFSRPTPVEIRPASVEDDLSDPSAWQYDMHAFAEQNASVPLDVMMEEELVAGAGI
jgi:hypothetical protein